MYDIVFIRLTKNIFVYIIMTSALTHFKMLFPFLALEKIREPLVF